MEPVCRGEEVAEARPEGILVQHYGATGFCNLRVMINSAKCRLSSIEEQKQHQWVE